MPIMIAESRAVLAATIKALMPYFASRGRLFGAKEPMPPICMPMELKFAKPHNM